MIRTTQELMQDIGQAARARRLAANLAQTGLEQRSGVSLGSIKSFERSGKISLEALLKIAMALGVSQETVRRDIRPLAQSGHVVKLHGIVVGTSTQPKVTRSPSATGQAHGMARGGTRSRVIVDGRIAVRTSAEWPVMKY